VTDWSVTFDFADSIWEVQVMNTTTRWKKIVSTVSIAGLLAGVLAGCGG